MARTKIVCTIGPASSNQAVLTQMVNAGMNVARLNFSHGTQVEHKKVIAMIRAVARKTGKTIAILGDLQGPRIRIGDIGDEARELKKGEQVIFTTNKKTDQKIPVTYNNFHEDLKVGDRILMVDGLIQLTVKKIFKKDVYASVDIGGQIKTHKGINLPDSAVSISALTEKDRKDVLFGVKQRVDFFALSFVRSPKDIFQLRQLIETVEDKFKIKTTVPIQIIVKTERKEAIDNITDIIEATDGVMIARGDLGIELPVEDVPLMQKMIIDMCLKKAKPVIVATQMLDSMIIKPRPTRAEVSDVANAVIDHTDAVMLSGESAVGKYPVESVQFLTKVIEKIEASSYDDLLVSSIARRKLSPDEAMIKMANILSNTTEVVAIIATTFNGKTAREISRFRPELKIYVGCSDKRLSRQLVLSWGIQPIDLLPCKDKEVLMKKLIARVKRTQGIKKNDLVVIVKGGLTQNEDKASAVELREVAML